MPSFLAPAPTFDVEAAAGDDRAKGGRLLRLDQIEQSVARAKVALGEAERAMRSVRAGLALEPMPLAVVPPALVQPELAMGGVPTHQMSVGGNGGPGHSSFYDPADLYRCLPWTLVPRVAMGVALVLLGWSLAFGLKVILGSQRFHDLLASVGSIAVQATPPGSTELAVAAVAAVAVDPARDEAVVIYERTSPYTALFSEISTKDRICLAEAIYYEARGEPIAGQIAVAQVVLNRTLGGSWPKSVCEVTHQGVEKGVKCQFSYACMKGALGKPQGDAWDNARVWLTNCSLGGRGSKRCSMLRTFIATT